jgi:hypothetical protein
MLLMALRKFLILRRLRSGRLEGRTTVMQPFVSIFSAAHPLIRGNDN